MTKFLTLLVSCGVRSPVDLGDVESSWLLLLLSPPRCSVTFFANPSSILRHRVAKFKLHKVSPTLWFAGLIFTNIKTFELPPRESWSKNVSFEFRKGICCIFLFPNALMTSPRAERDRLMFCASFKRSPVASVLLVRSIMRSYTCKCHYLIKLILLRNSMICCIVCCCVDTHAREEGESVMRHAQSIESKQTSWLPLPLPRQGLSAWVWVRMSTHTHTHTHTRTHTQTWSCQIYKM